MVGSPDNDDDTASLHDIFDAFVAVAQEIKDTIASAFQAIWDYPIPWDYVSDLALIAIMPFAAVFIAILAGIVLYKGVWPMVRWLCRLIADLVEIGWLLIKRGVRRMGGQ